MAEILKNRIQFAVEGENKVITAQKKIADSAKKTAKSLDDLRKEAAGLRTDLRMLKEDNARLVKSNHALTSSYKKTSVATKKAAKSQKLLNKEQDITYRNNRNLLGSFSVLRSKLLLAAFAAGMLSRTLGKYVNAAADVEEVTNKFNVVFGESSESAHQFATTLSSSVGRARSSLLEMLSSLQDTFVPLGFARDASADLSKVLTKLSIDVASFNNAADDDVMRAFQSAIVGNHEAVRSFGIVLTEAEIKSHALSKGIIDTNRELTSQEKVLARVSLIFNSTKDAHGDALRTQESYANSVKRLSANIKTLTEVMGDVLMPIATDLVSVMSDLVKVFTDTSRLKAYAVSIIAITNALILYRIATAAATIQTKVLKRAMMTTGIGVAVVLLGEFLTRVVFAREELEDLTSSTISFEEAMENLKASIRETGFGIDDLNYSELNEKLVATEISYKNLSPFIEGASDRTKKHILNLELLIEALKEAIDPTEKVISGFKTKIAILKAGNEVEKESIRIAAQMGVDVANLDPEIKKLIEDYIKEKEAVDAANKSKKEAIKLADKQKKATERLTAQRGKISESFYGKLDELRLSDYDLAIKLLKAEVKEYRMAVIDKSDIDDYYRERKAELDAEAREKELEAQEEKRQNFVDAANEIQGMYGGFASAEKKRVDANLKNELNALKQTHNWRVASTEQRAVMEENVRAKHADDQAKAFRYEKQASLLNATIKAYEAVNTVLAKVPPPFNIAAAAAVLVIAKKQITAIAGTPAPSYAEGGMIGGRAHSAGGTMIEAERGEFIIKKKAVQAIGTEYLNSLNNSFQEGGLITGMTDNKRNRLTNLVSDLGDIPSIYGLGAGIVKATVREGVKEGRYQLGGLVDSGIPEPSQNIINVNITGNVMTDDFTRDKIIPEIQQALRLNLA